MHRVGDDGVTELRWVIGTVVVRPVVEQAMAVGVGWFFPGSDPERIAAHAEWAAPWAVDDQQQVRMAIQALCVDDGGTRIVVDTCVGQRPLPELFESMADDGGFLTAMADAGFAVDDVDVVICTHLHFDHVGWNTRWEGDRWVPTFPNARYVLARPEYEHWRAQPREVRDAHSAVTFDAAVEPLFAFGAVDLVECDHQVTSTVSLMPTPGHSPGHVSVRIRSEGADAIITGDCVHSPLQLAEPDWFTAVDSDTDRSTETRRALVAECCDRDVLVIGTHFPPPTAGHIVSTPDGGVRFRPLS